MSEWNRGLSGILTSRTEEVLVALGNTTIAIALVI